MIQSDLTRLINGEEVQTKVRAAIKTVKTARLKKNPLTNLGAMVHLNPYALALKRSQLLTEQRRKAHKAALLAVKRGDAKEAKKVDTGLAAQEKAHRAANKKHSVGKNQLKNYKFIAGGGKEEPKLVQPKLDLAKMQADNDAATKAAAPAKGAEKKGDAKAAAPAKAAAGAAKATDAKADKGAEKKAEAGKKGGDAAGKKGGDAEKKGGDGEKKGGEGKKGGDAGAKKGGDAGAKKGGDAGGKKGGDAGKKGEKKA
jgi:hypothetical protein